MRSGYAFKWTGPPKGWKTRKNDEDWEIVVAPTAAIKGARFQMAETVIDGARCRIFLGGDGATYAQMS